MPIVYEHWRPDTNDCFYVGISKHSDIEKAKKRANNFQRSNEHYNKILNFLKKKGIAPVVKIFAIYEDKESAIAMEKMRISYWRGVGDKLTNVCVGGEGLGCGEDHPSYGKPGPWSGKTGPESPMFGRKGEDHPKYGNSKGGKSLPGRLNGMYGRTGDSNPSYGSIGPLRGIKGPDHPRYGKDPWNKNLPKELQPTYGKRWKIKNSGVDSKKAKLTQQQAEEVRELAIGKNMKQIEIAKLYDISLILVQRIKAGKAYPSILSSEE